MCSVRGASSLRVPPARRRAPSGPSAPLARDSLLTRHAPRAVSFPSSVAGLAGWARLRAPSSLGTSTHTFPRSVEAGNVDTHDAHDQRSLFVHPVRALESSLTAPHPAHGSAPRQQASAAHRQAHEHLRLNCIECLTRYHPTYIVPTGTNAFVRRTAPSRPINPRASRAPSPRRQYSNPKRLSKNLRPPRTGCQSTGPRSTAAARARIAAHDV